jgi:protein-tyrosine-phosphatase
MGPQSLTISPGVRLAWAVAQPLRAGARWIRHAPERLLHPVRRWRACRRVARTRPRSVLVVCHGNICRSPYAARRLQSLLAAGVRARITVGSAGFLAPGHLSPAHAVAAAETLGIDLSDHRSRQLTGDLIRGADLVLVMDGTQQQAITTVHGHRSGTTLMLGDFDPEPISTRGIPDPYGRSLGAFVRCYGRVDRCVATLAAAMGAAPSVQGSRTRAFPTADGNAAGPSASSGRASSAVALAPRARAYRAR